MAEEKEFVFVEWLAEGLKGLSCRRSDEFATHMRAARKEILLAARSLLDVAIERAEKSPRKKATRIEVQ